MSRKKLDDILTFKIDSFTPQTIPQLRLAEYMVYLAKMYGNEESVHFAGLKKGSACIQSRIDNPAIPKVRSRLDGLHSGDADQDVMKAYKTLDQMLADDNAVGKLTDHATSKIIQFPGRTRQKPSTYGPIIKEGSLDGFLTLVGGRDKTISLQLQSDNVTYTSIETERSIAKRISAHLFEPVRIHGRGRWIREEDGVWKLKHFKVTDFDILEKGSLQDVLTEIRKVPGSGWAEIPDPLKELQEIRDEDKIH